MLGKWKLLLFSIFLSMSGVFYYLALSGTVFFVIAIFFTVIAGFFFILYTRTLGKHRAAKKHANKIADFLGTDNVSIKEYEKKLYSRDAAPLPGIVTMLFNTTPDIIVKSHDEAALTQLFRYVRNNKIPLTLAAAKTSLMAGTHPITGGIVLDLMENDGIVELDEASLTVTVRAATVWKDLLEYLEFHGYTLGLYPSSSPAATIGGFISTGGIGIGGFRNGGIPEQVVDIKFLTLDGKVVHTNPLKIGTRVGINLNMIGLGTEGTLGLVLEATLRIFPKPEKRSYHTITFTDQDNMFGFINDLVESDLTPFHVEWKDKFFVDLLRDMDFEFGPNEESFIFCALDGSEEVVDAELQVLYTLIQKWDGHDHGYEKSIEEWNERFYPMRVKRLGPNILGGEVLIPIKSIPKALKKFEKAARSLGKDHGVEGAMGPRTGTTALCDILVDERQFFNYLFSVSSLIDVADIGFELGGRNYTFNAWNSFFMNRVFNKPHRQINNRLKDKFDSDRILQSYKTVDTPKTVLGLKFRPFMYTAALNLVKILNNRLLLGGLLLTAGGIITVLAIFMPPNFFMDLANLILGSETQVGLTEPIFDVQSLLSNWNLMGLAYGIIAILDYKIYGILSWLVFLGIFLVYVGAWIATRNAKNGALLSWLFIGIVIIRILSF